MKAIVKEISENKDHIVLTIFNSSDKKQYDTKIPKYFLKDSGGMWKVGDRVRINISKFECK